MTDTTLAGHSTVGAWLNHPEGRPIVTAIARGAGTDEKALSLLRNVPLARFLDAGGPAPAGVLAPVVSRPTEGGFPRRRR